MEISNKKIFELGGVNVNEINSLQFGSKISKLNHLFLKGLPIPQGFFFSCEISSQLKSKTFDKSDLQLLEKIFLKLLKATKTNKVIARSSMSIEDDKEHLFPGIFKSIKQLASFDEFVQAIYDCIDSQNSDNVKDYADFLDVSVTNSKSSILVQEEISPIYSGLAHLAGAKRIFKAKLPDYIEIIKGELDDLMLGSRSPSVYLINEDEKINTLSLISKSKNCEVLPDEIYPYLNALHEVFEKIKNELKCDLVVEFAIDNDGIKILQAREHIVNGPDPLRTTRNSVPDAEDNPNIVLEGESKYGLKGAAMKKFKELKLFNYPLIFIDQGTPLYEIKKRLNNEHFGENGITVRYSLGNEIGLPRFFASNSSEAFSKIADTYNKDYFIIIHSYLDITRSYELLVDEEYLALEHIPGLWEANNTLEPDVMYLDNNDITILKVRDRRQKTISTPFSSTHEFEEPVQFDFLKERLNKVINICNKIIYPHFKADSFPLNFHFVETVNNDFVFLNIRKIIRHKKRYVRGGSFFHVSNIDDLKGWDEKTPILLKINVPRGQEKQLISLAKALPKGNCEVFICFGYLSHPAILMREFGVDVVPAYFDREIISYKLKSE